MTLPALQHDISVCFDTATVPWSSFTAPGLPAGLSMRTLRRLENGKARSVILRVPTGWRSDALKIIGAPQQYFMLSGVLSVGSQKLTANAFMSGFANQAIPPMRCDAEASLIAIYDSGPAYEPITAWPVGQEVNIIPDAYAVPSIAPTIKGVSLVGFERRVLWENKANGADTRLLKIPGGFEGFGPNWHPVHEEIYQIAGRGGPDDGRVLSAGWYLWNPAFGVHGYHEHSQDGMTLLEWHDGQWAYNPYTDTAA